MTCKSNANMPYSRQYWANRWSFFCAGALFSTWGVHAPTIKSLYKLDAGQFSWLLFAMGVGAILGLTQASVLINRYSAPLVAYTGGCISSLLLSLFLAMPTFFALLLLLSVFGFFTSLLDVAMNTIASDLERISKKHIISNMHGMFSLGGMIGAFICSILIDLQVPEWQQLLLATFYCCMLFYWTDRQLSRLALLKSIQNSGATKNFSRMKIFAMPSKKLALLGLIACFGFIVEGAIYDWSVIFLKEVRDQKQQLAALAYVAFTASMALTRFILGDRMRMLYSELTLLRSSAILTAIALTIAFLPLPWWVSIFGFALAGVSLANVVPVLFGAATKLNDKSPSEAIASVATIAYFGFLLGPALIGFIARISSLTIALHYAVICSWLMAILSKNALSKY